MKILRRFLTWVRRRKLEAEMAEEMRLHLEHRARERIADGLSPEEARFAALRKFGGLEQAKERCREQRSFMWTEHLGQDLRYAWRALRRQPGFTSVAVLTLALGIGANTAMFAFFNALSLRTLAVADPERLVLFRSLNGDESFSYPTFERLSAGATTLTSTGMFKRMPDARAMVASGLGGTGAENVLAQPVSGGFFPTLGLRPALGRLFSATEDREEAPASVAVLSHAYWQRRFGGDPGVLEKVIQLDGVSLTIVGVMPADFAGFTVGHHPEVWWPLALAPQFELNPGTRNRLKAEGWEWGLIVGRLREGVSREQASAELRTLFRREREDVAARSTMGEKERRDYLARTLDLIPAGNGFTPMRKFLARPLVVLGLIVGFVLLIACANLAGLLLARGAARQRELAVRAALGAGRGRIVRQLLTESLLLAGAGGVAGCAAAYAGTRVLEQMLQTPWGQLAVQPDGRMLAFAGGATLLTGVLFGLVPALRLSRSTTAVTARATAGGANSRLNQALVVAQIALSVTLLAGAGLFVRSLQKLQATELGFQPERIAWFSLQFGRGYDAQRRAEVHRRVIDGMAAWPSVRSATLSGGGLLGGDAFGIQVGVDGYTPQPGEDMRALVVVAGPKFFETLGIVIRSGRGFIATDEPPLPATGSGFPRKVIVGESFARRFFGDADPIGRTLRYGNNPQQPPLEIVGVARDVKYRSLRETPEMEIYVPFFGGPIDQPVVVQAALRGEVGTFAADLRGLLQTVDPQVTASAVGTMQELIDRSLLQERMVANFGGFFSAFALVLASLGLYGLLAYGVTQRTREIGVRMALGARAADVLALIVGQGVKLALIGAALGVAGALATTHLAEKLLYGVEPNDPVTFLGVAALLLAVAAIAAWLPARRAAKVDPMVALRAE